MLLNARSARLLLFVTTSVLGFPADAAFASMYSGNNNHANNSAYSSECDSKTSLRRGCENALVVAGISYLDQETAEEQTAPAEIAEDRKSGGSRRAGDEANTIVVTGTNISGSGPVGQRVDVVTGEQITQSGYATLYQFMQTYVQNYGGGKGEDTIDVNSQGNFTSATGVNLRGLGNSATLLLVNGKRVAIAGLDASFSDVSLIPSSAIERVEILSDGGSAIYGTDAVAGVVNIILRKDFDGAESRARFGTVTKGGLQEYLFSQIFGSAWESGHSIISYEYLRRERLNRSVHDYTANSDLRPYGGSDYREFYSNPGNIVNPFTFEPEFAIPAGQDGRNLSPSSLIPGTVNLSSLYAYGTVLPQQTRHSVYLYTDHELNENLSLFLEGRYNFRKAISVTISTPEILVVPSTNAFFVDPYGDSDFLYVAYDMTKDLGGRPYTSKVHDYNAILGGRASIKTLNVRFFAAAVRQNSEELGKNVVIYDQLNQALADSNPDTAFNPFGDGTNTNPRTLAQMRGEITNNVNATMLNGNIIVDGVLGSLPAGELKFAVGGDVQDLRFDLKQRGSARRVQTSAKIDRQIASVFGELQVPLISDASIRNINNTIDLSLAVRYDDYSDVGSTTNPKIGATWQIGNFLRLRGNWGTSFRAPNLTNLDESRNFTGSFQTTVPQVPNQQVLILYMTGPGNEELKNQKSDNWSAGLSLEPGFAPGLVVDVNYFSIKYKNKISSMPYVTSPFSNPEAYGQFAIINPTQEDVNKLCSLPYIMLFSPVICENAGAIYAIVDNRLKNLARSHVNGIDGSILYQTPINDDNDLSVRISGTYMFDFREATSEEGDFQEMVDTLGYPVDFRARAEIGLTHKKALNAILFVNYIDSYRDKTNEPFLKVKSWTTFDVNLSLNTEHVSSSPVFSGMTLALNVVNIFNKKPPFVNGRGQAYDANNADPLGRFISFNLTKKW